MVCFPFAGEILPAELSNIERYIRSLQKQGNLLMLEGLNERVLEQLQQTDVLSLIGADDDPGNRYSAVKDGDYNGTNQVT